MDSSQSKTDRGLATEHFRTRQDQPYTTHSAMGANALLRTTGRQKQTWVPGRPVLEGNELDAHRQEVRESVLQVCR